MRPILLPSDQYVDCEFSVTDTPANLLLPDRFDKRIHIALPVRVTYWDEQNRPRLQMACTYDISPHGARVAGLQRINEGDIVLVERARNRAYCRVAWIGEDNSELRGQVGLQCIENDKPMWEAELREMQEIYEPVSGNVSAAARAVTGAQMRRRGPRFPIDGVAELMRVSSEAQSGLEARIKNIGQNGCLVGTQSMLTPGTNLRLVLNVGNYDFTVKGEVRHAMANAGLGIQFLEIRKGDRPVLQYILRKLAENAQEIGPIEASPVICP